MPDAAPPPTPASTVGVDEQLMRVLGAAAVQYTGCAEGDEASVACVLTAASDVVRILGPDTAPLTAAPLLVRAVTTLAKEVDFGKRLGEGTVSVAPLANLLVHLPEPLRGEYSRTLKEVVVKDLAEPRAPGTPRITVFAMGELFARMVSIGHMPVDAAVNIITRMVKARDKRMAGMTMLGKTVEFCFELLTGKASLPAVQGLRDELQALKGDQEYAYDLEFISSAMGWTEPPPSTTPQPAAAPKPAAAPAPAAQAPAPKVGAVVTHSAPAAAPTPVGSFPARPGGIFAMAVDTTRRAVVATVTPTTGPEVGQMFDPVAGYRGEFAMGPAGADTITNSLDIIAPGVMLASMMPRGRSPGDCCVRLFSFNNAAAAGDDTRVPPYADMGCLLRPQAKPLVSTRWLLPTGNFAFVQGEAHSDPSVEGGRRQAVVVFEISPGANFGTLQPAQQFLGHTGTISAVLPYPDNPSLLFSAGGDATIRLWDRRLIAGGAGTLVFGSPGTQTAHGDMVVTLTARGHTLVSAGMDQAAVQWDLRVLGQGQGRSTPHVATWAAPDGSPFLRAAMAPQGDSSPAALATAFGGVYVADVHGAAQAQASGAPAPALRQAGKHAQGAGRYHTLAWEAATGLLVGGWSATGQGAETSPRVRAGSTLPSRIDVWRS